MIKIKTIKPILVACIEGNGQIPDFNKDLNSLFKMAIPGNRNSNPLRLGGAF